MNQSRMTIFKAPKAEAQELKAEAQELKAEAQLLPVPDRLLWLERRVKCLETDIQKLQEKVQELEANVKPEAGYSKKMYATENLVTQKPINQEQKYKKLFADDFVKEKNEFTNVRETQTDSSKFVLELTKDDDNIALFCICDALTIQKFANRSDFLQFCEKENPPEGKTPIKNLYTTHEWDEQYIVKTGQGEEIVLTQIPGKARRSVGGVLKKWIVETALKFKILKTVSASGINGSQPARESPKQTTGASQKEDVKENNIIANKNDNHKRLFAGFIENNELKDVQEKPTNLPVFELKLTGGNTASFYIYEGAINRVIQRPNYLAGCESEIAPNGTRLEQVVLGKARESDGKWMIETPLKVRIT